MSFVLSNFLLHFYWSWAENKSKKLTWSTLCFFFCQILAILNSLERFSIFRVVIKKCCWAKVTEFSLLFFLVCLHHPLGTKSVFWLNISVKKFRIRGWVTCTISGSFKFWDTHRLKSQSKTCLKGFVKDLSSIIHLFFNRQVRRLLVAFFHVS